MKKVIAIILMVVSVGAFADQDFEVSGEGSNGRYYSGTIHAENGKAEVSGDLVDEYGNDATYDGEWDGNRAVTGETDRGVQIDFDI